MKVLKFTTFRCLLQLIEYDGFFFCLNLTLFYNTVTIQWLQQPANNMYELIYSYERVNIGRKTIAVEVMHRRLVSKYNLILLKTSKNFLLLFDPTFDICTCYVYTCIYQYLIYLFLFLSFYVFKYCFTKVYSISLFLRYFYSFLLPRYLPSMAINHFSFLISMLKNFCFYLFKFLLFVFLIHWASDQIYIIEYPVCLAKCEDRRDWEGGMN